MTHITDAIVEAAADLSDRQFAAASVRLCERAVDTVIASFDRSAVGGSLSRAIGAHLACYWDAIEPRDTNDTTDPGSIDAVLSSRYGARELTRALSGVRCVSDVAVCVEDAGLSVLGMLCQPDWNELVKSPRVSFEHVALFYSSAARCMSTELREASVRGVAQDRQVLMSDSGTRLRCAPLWQDCPSDRTVELRTTVPSEWELRFVSNGGVAQAAMCVIENAISVAPDLGPRGLMLARQSDKYIAELASCDMYDNAREFARRLCGFMIAWHESEECCNKDDIVSTHTVTGVIKDSSSAIELCRNNPRTATVLLRMAAMNMWRLLKEINRDDAAFIEAMRATCIAHRVHEK